MANPTPATIQLFSFPYRRLINPRPVAPEVRRVRKHPGTAMVWRLDRGSREEDRGTASNRPGGMALLVILPKAADIANDRGLWELVARTRPHAILPYHQDPHVDDLSCMLRKPPEDVPAAVTDYLRWRGIPLDGDTVHLIRRTLELSADLSSVTALSRSLYLSRRALGRRFSSRGLPVPSHWLQFGRILRFSLSLQNTSQSIHSVAVRLGYPDGFAVSNQVNRLIGYRPSDVRAHLGWEWILESWLRKEADAGTLRPYRPDWAERRAPIEDQAPRRRERAAG